MAWAANASHFNILLFLHANRNEGCDGEMFDWCGAFIELPESAQWLYDKYPETVDF